MLTAIAAAGLLLAALILWMAGGLQGPRDDRAPTEALPGPPPLAEPRTRPECGRTIRVVSWNIAWGYGKGSEGTGPKKPRAHFEHTLEKMGRLLGDLDVDVALLQEVDFDATRSHYINQAWRLADISGLSHLAEAVSWRAQWVPFPYWPPSRHFGYLRSGGAILSRWPLEQHRVTLLPKPDANPFWYNLFYLFRYLQSVRVEHPGGSLAVANLHLEAFDKASRSAQAKAIAARFQSATDALDLFGGDFNAIPQDAHRQHGFADDPEADYRNDETLPIFDALPTWVRAQDEGTFSFPAGAPNRLLDHIYVKKPTAIHRYRVVSEAKELSDHLPVLVELCLSPAPSVDGPTRPERP